MKVDHNWWWTHSLCSVAVEHTSIPQEPLGVTGDGAALIVLDGTWAQARSIFTQNPRLHSVRQVCVFANIHWNMTNAVCHWGSALVHPCPGSTGHWEKEWVRHQNTAYKRLRVNVGVCGPCTGLAGEEPRHCGGKPRSPHLPSLQETWLHWRRTRDCEDNLLTLTCIACQNHCIVCQNHITANLCHVRNDDEERR